MVGVKTEVGNRSSMALWAAAQVMAQMGELDLAKLEEQLLLRGGNRAILDAIRRVAENYKAIKAIVQRLKDVVAGRGDVSVDDIDELKNAVLDLVVDVDALIEEGVLTSDYVVDKLGINYKLEGTRRFPRVTVEVDGVSIYASNRYVTIRIGNIEIEPDKWNPRRVKVMHYG